MYVWINVIKHNIQFLFNQGKQTGCRMWIWYMRRVQHGCWKLRTRMPNASVLVWDNSGLVLESVGGQMHCFMRRCCSVWAGHGYAGPVAGCLRGFSSALWLELSRFWPVTASCTWRGDVQRQGSARALHSPDNVSSVNFTNSTSWNWGEHETASHQILRKVTYPAVSSSRGRRSKWKAKAFNRMP